VPGTSETSNAGLGGILGGCKTRGILSAWVLIQFRRRNWVCIGGFAKLASRKKIPVRVFSFCKADIRVIVGDVKAEVVLVYGIFRVGFVHPMGRFHQHLVGRLGGLKPFPYKHLY